MYCTKINCKIGHIFIYSGVVWPCAVLLMAPMARPYRDLELLNSITNTTFTPREIRFSLIEIQNFDFQENPMITHWEIQLSQSEKSGCHFDIFDMWFFPAICMDIGHFVLWLLIIWNMILVCFSWFGFEHFSRIFLELTQKMFYSFQVPNCT